METTIESNFRMKSIIRSVLFCIVFTALLVVFSFAKNFVPNNFERIAHGTIGTLAAFVATVLFLKLDRKRFSDIGLTFQRQTITRFFTGVVCGIIIMGVIAGSVICFAGVEIVANQKSNFLNFMLMTL